jgi:N-acetyl-alpha-D-muramate 1-phosphate uridylyltransferase
VLPIAVLAGGLGTRVRDRTGPDLPKALLPVAGIPFIDLKLSELRAGGAERLVILAGHGADALERHVGDGSAYDLRIDVIRDPPGLLGTGGALLRAVPALGDAFIVTYGDTLLEVAMAELEDRLLDAPEVGGVMTVLRNEDRWEVSNVDVEDGVVTAYEKPATPGHHRYIDYGMLALRSSCLTGVASGERFDLADVLHRLVVSRSLLAQLVGRRFYDIGNEISFAETERFVLAQRTPVTGCQPPPDP